MGHAVELGWGLSVLLSVAATAATSALVACGPVPDAPSSGSSAPASVESASENGEAMNHAPAAEAPPAAESATVPFAAFPTIGALCAAQRAMTTSRLARIIEARRTLEPGLADEPLPAPSCAIDTQVLARTRVHLSERTGPYLELAAIGVETGSAFETHLVVRTAVGWQALPDALTTDVHDDPGCPSILRDGPPVEILVSGGEPRSLVIVGEASRGAGEEVDPSDEDRVLVRYETLTRVRACRPATEGAAFTCTEPRVVEQRFSVSDGREPRTTIAFSTTYRVGPLGEVLVASAPPLGSNGLELEDALR